MTNPVDGSPAQRRLDGKVAVVTGGGSRAAGIGTGRAAAILFARHGARVLVVDRDEDAANATVDMIAAEGGEAVAVAADLTVEDDCTAMAAAAVGRWGRIDILDNNVGIEGPGTILDATSEDWDRVMAVNVRTIVQASRAVVPVMATGGGGSIVNLSSISALRPRGLTPYTAAKGAVIALTRAMAIDHAAAGIRVNCIAPGPIYTPMVYAAGMADELRDRRRAASPLGIEGTGWDVGFAALFLVSDEARYITGTVLPVDGGVSIRSPDR
ncbi:SDR family NAD(P)-dependent oxidoreductase [Pseudonocardia alaniniphila]|uniref:SDR family oxidoreductase n=2 Tax=Pseudonocardia alaniniphila TaxID=75291 RepID=A0ABS9TAA7_9PSEU|nr:SDR family NAD(P)-dependent oxidoreductase [Pseudonocardia alaniniphila]MCH6165474.1 SDR family oxidoreductase [Pseudonocardia alaniniphila]